MGGKPSTRVANKLRQVALKNKSASHTKIKSWKKEKFVYQVNLFTLNLNQNNYANQISNQIRLHTSLEKQF